jgi:hypothetical protein
MALRPRVMCILVMGLEMEVELGEGVKTSGEGRFSKSEDSKEMK